MVVLMVGMALRVSCRGRPDRAFGVCRGWSRCPGSLARKGRSCLCFFRRTDDRCRVRMYIFVIITKKMSIPLSHLLPRDSRQEK